MKSYQFKTNSPEETMAFAERLASVLTAGDVITLEGDLGAGKTTFTKGLAKGLHITRTVNSPTFTIVKEYNGDFPLYHIDAYRLEGSDEDIGFEEYFAGDGITVVEWAKFIMEFLPEEHLDIQLVTISEKERNIILNPNSNRYENKCRELLS
ncbi:tRNA threonylcarbamoyladenosine biosynthesis protein TsaE [Salirhabdus euzebyi]|uniref:tRNA threonylcarbamoyladenosine biosynthesis protein TsaE n=1 Tax=Salirhabdus euzebyi TaxID=394506 RepID=A0A841Q8X5_9BACI|nr:tRNA (adenosine(37)-N6)-threonylcarbamoyltransferase complex ATPase subunit type 1 TsaE [Salirhabdus euzebyi]MBB6454858.1 tRNA threonylcarbamoyladenosine biosynthesis protein TsaE [Salirhabdus euzebyi]